MLPHSSLGPESPLRGLGSVLSLDSNARPEVVPAKPSSVPNGRSESAKMMQFSNGKPSKAPPSPSQHKPAPGPLATGPQIKQIKISPPARLVLASALNL